MSYRHLLCKHQYICGATNMSRRHLLCKYQYNCGATDHSHRHLLCKRQKSCAATQITHTNTCSAKANIIAATRSQFDTLSGPLQTHLPLWRALPPSRGRLRTVADGCERLRSQTQLLVNTTSPPYPPSEMRILATHSGKKKKIIILEFKIYIYANYIIISNLIFLKYFTNKIQASHFYIFNNSIYPILIPNLSE